MAPPTPAKLKEMHRMNASSTGSLLNGPSDVRRALDMLWTPMLLQPHALQKPRKGRDSTAQGTAKRSPGLGRERKAESPNGAKFPGSVVRCGNLGPLGLLRIHRHVPRAAPGQPASPWAIESRPFGALLRRT